MSDKALHLIPSTSTTTTGYTTWPPPVASISWFESLSQIELWCFPLHLWQVEVHLHSDTALCLVPGQLKHNLLSDSYLLLLANALILSQSTDLCSSDLQKTQPLCFPPSCLAWSNGSLPLSRLPWLPSRETGFLSHHFLKASTNCKNPHSCQLSSSLTRSALICLVVYLG